MIKKKKLTYISEEGMDEKKKKGLKEKLKQCQKEKEEYLTQAQRARADLINYRQRQEKALEELKTFGQANVLKEILPVLDSLEMGSKDNEGIGQIKEQMKNVLDKYDLKEIKSVGEEFNPEFHEAVDQIKSKEKSGTVVEEVQKGYLLNNLVLRPSKVKVSK